MKNKIFSFINVFGLTVGLTCCMLITLYILNELSYDKYHKNADNLYQLGTLFITPGEEIKPENWSANTPAPMAQLMKQEFPEIKETTRLLSLFTEDKTLLQYKENNGDPKSFYETKGYLTDSTFFRLFTYNFTEGDAATALNNPNTIVLAEDIAKKIFGNQPALNKIIHISSSTNGDSNYTVTGVFKPINAPSHIDARFFMSIKGGGMEEYIKRRGTDLASNNMFFTYFLLRPASDPKQLEAKFPAFMQKYAAKDLKAMGRDKNQFLTALKDIHLHPLISQNVTPTGCRRIYWIVRKCLKFI